MRGRVVGYYSLSAGSLHAADLPKVIRRRLSKYPVPVVMRGRFAISRVYQRQGIGSILLGDNKPAHCVACLPLTLRYSRLSIQSYPYLTTIFRYHTYVDGCFALG
jgi:hypothetical protein